MGADGLTLVALAVALLGAGVALLALRRGGGAGAVARLEAKLDTLTQQLGARLGEASASARELNALVAARIGDTGRSLGDVAERLARLDEATRQVERVGRSVAGLEALLASPKLRGGIGEWSLETVLRDVLPSDMILTQHRLATGVIVDVALRLPDGRLLPIDSKFPLEAYRRMAENTGEEADGERRELHRVLRRRVDEIASKYIAPEHQTTEFALMFVPSEAVFYELAVRDEGSDVVEYARVQRVVPCSPGTLHAYLQAVLVGLRGVQIAGRAREVQIALEAALRESLAARELLERGVVQLRNGLSNIESASDAVTRAEARLAGASSVRGPDLPQDPLQTTAEL